MTLRKSFFLVAVLILLLAACQPVSVEEAQAQLCTQLDEFQAALNGLSALTAESTMEDAEAALELVADEWDDVANSAYDYSDAAYENLDEAYEDLDDALGDVDEAASLGDAVTSVQDEVANVNTAYDEFRAPYCPE
jgi:hypothetical protein